MGRVAHFLENHFLPLHLQLQHYFELTVFENAADFKI